MLPLSERTETLRQSVMQTREYQDSYFAQRIVYFALGMQNAAQKNLSNNEIIATGIANTLKKFTPVIMPGELIVGFNFSNGKDYGSFGENTPKNRALLRGNGISDSDIDAFFDYKKNKPSLLNTIGPDISRAEREANTEWAAKGRCIDSNHTVLDYSKVLK